MYLVTGGGGFIGSHLVRALVMRGDRVRVLDNESSGGQWRIADVLSDVDWKTGDARDTSVVQQACQGVEVVLHHAAIASVPLSVREPEMTHDINVTGTLNMLSAARTAGVRRVVFASSAAVYGDSNTVPKIETQPTLPVSPYGAQKLAAESYCRIYSHLYGLETVCLRYFNIFGPGQDPTSDYAAVIPRFISASLSGRSPTVYGDGQQTRDFLHIQNVVEINLLAASAPEANGVVLNVGGGVAISLNQLVTHLEGIIGAAITVASEPERSGDIRASVADTSLMRATLGYTPSVSFAEGLRRTVEAYQGASGHASGAPTGV